MRASSQRPERPAALIDDPSDLLVNPPVSLLGSLFDQALGTFLIKCVLIGEDGLEQKKSKEHWAAMDYRKLRYALRKNGSAGNGWKAGVPPPRFKARTCASR